jgi:hypothetical protein
LGPARGITDYYPAWLDNLAADAERLAAHARCNRRDHDQEENEHYE